MNVSSKYIRNSQNTAEQNRYTPKTSATTSTMLKICLGWCGPSSFMVSGFHFSGDLFTILSAAEDSRSLMGGSDVVHCV